MQSEIRCVILFNVKYYFLSAQVRPYRLIVQVEKIKCTRFQMNNLIQLNF